MTSPPADHEAITRKLYEYAYGIDTRDWALFRNVFADEITMDFSSYNGTPTATMAADTWVYACRELFAGLGATQHVMSNPLVDQDGDSARCRMYMKAEHFLANDRGADEFSIGGYYDNQLVSAGGEWKITAVTLNVWWSRGNRNIMDLARAAGKANLAAHV